MNFKKIFTLIISLSLIIYIGIYTSGSMALSSEIALIPLDSRPCNTDYTKYAAKALNKNIHFPKEALDRYNKPSNPEKLYEFLYDSLETSDTYIIYTNQILNGGLITSRDPQSYLKMESKLESFRNFLETAKEKDKKVIVVSVLPRVIPSQFTDLWNFHDELITYSTNFGKIKIDLEKNQPKLPPKEIIARYLSIYSGSDLIINSMIKNTEDELINLFVIGQDDTYHESITNHQINKYLENKNEKIIVQPGADELTKLILARLVREESPDSNLNLKIMYSAPEDASEVRAFESFPTEDRSANILDFLSISNNENSNNLAILHNKPGKATETINMIYNNANKNYLGLIDIAYINRGDPELFASPNYLRNLKGYSGWNTIGNSMGTEYANLVIYDFLQKNLSSFTPEKQVEMLENYYKLLYIHYADDYLYQGNLRSLLNSHLLENNENTSFIKDKEAAEVFLQELYENHSRELNNSLTGNYHSFDSIFEINYSLPEVSLPWNRTFEARIVPNLEIKMSR